jgi:hypothetical protein
VICVGNLVLLELGQLSRYSDWATDWTTEIDSRHGQGMDILSLSPRPHRLWGPSSLLSNGYKGFFPWG